VSSGVVEIRYFGKLHQPLFFMASFAACNPPQVTVLFAQVTAMYARDAFESASKGTSAPVVGNGAPQGENKAG